MTCKAALARMTDYQQGDLPPAARARVAAHLAACPRCRETFAVCAAAGRELRALAPQLRPAPRSLRPPDVAAVRRDRLALRWALAGAAVAVIGLVALGIQQAPRRSVVTTKQADRAAEPPVPTQPAPEAAAKVQPPLPNTGATVPLQQPAAADETRPAPPSAAPAVDPFAPPRQAKAAAEAPRALEMPPIRLKQRLGPAAPAPPSTPSAAAEQPAPPSRGSVEPVTLAAPAPAAEPGAIAPAGPAGPTGPPPAADTGRTAAAGVPEQQPAATAPAMAPNAADRQRTTTTATARSLLGHGETDRKAATEALKSALAQLEQPAPGIAAHRGGVDRPGASAPALAVAALQATSGRPTKVTLAVTGALPADLAITSLDRLLTIEPGRRPGEFVLAVREADSRVEFTVTDRRTGASGTYRLYVPAADRRGMGPTMALAPSGRDALTGLAEDRDVVVLTAATRAPSFVGQPRDHATRLRQAGWQLDFRPGVCNAAPPRR